MDMSKLQPLGNRVIIRNIEEDNMKATGIIMPSNKNDRLKEGEVVAVGPGKRDADGKLIPMNVQVGNKVMYGKYAAIELTKGNDELLMVVDEEIVGIFA